MAKFSIKKQNMKKTAGKPVVSSRPVIDFPLQNERIGGPGYTVRVGVPSPASRVEIAFNQGPWLPCRESVGYWWFDWSDFAPGEHELVVRVKEQTGDWLLSDSRQCFAVEPIG